MKRLACSPARPRFIGAASVLVALSVAGLSRPVLADPTLRVQFDQRGDFVMFGNSSGYECGSGPIAPVVGDVTCPMGMGANNGDTSPDIFWRSDAPAAGEATANGTVTPGQARTTSVLNLPADATVTYARLYWAGYRSAAQGADNAVTLQRPGGALDETVMADDSFTAVRGMNDTNGWYQSTADVTDLVSEHGEGAYRLGGIASIDFRNTDTEDPVVAWIVVVMYELDTDPPRNLALFDGLDLVRAGSDVTVGIDGFLVPNAGYDAKLGVITYEGEDSLTGDSLLFNDNELSDGVNPENNFFNSSRSFLGMPVSVMGDLPQLTGQANSMSGVDFDVVDITDQVAPGDTSATIEATSGGDTYLLGAFVTSISTFRPDFSTSNKVFEDLNGGTVLPGDVLEYTITTENTGNDTAVGTVLTDALPEGLEFVPGSIEIVSGENAGEKTDDAGDDQAEYDEDSRTIIVRLGSGADETNGGEVPVGEGSTIRFRATVSPDASGTIENQAIVTAEGELGAPSADYPTDGNGEGPGVPPTETVIGGCEDDSDCGSDAPICDTEAGACVGCLDDSDCRFAANPDCLMGGVCGCAEGEGECATDSDGDGLADEDEETLGTDPNDADSDDDGVPDGQEPNFDEDTDDDGLINALDPDSDNDGLFDGTELGLDCDGDDTNESAGHCRPDADGGDTTTDPLDADSDDGGVSDGAEDFNLNGRIDDGELDPNDPSDDDDAVDTDGDGLTDGLEEEIGTDPNDADSDDDGVPDGEEPNPSDDTDGDGLINALDPDSDDDGLFDGTEMGRGCSGEGTRRAAGHCRPDADGGATTTNPLNPDTDGGGVSDGAEDFNLDGEVDDGELDPNDPSDDSDITDSDDDGLSDGLEAEIGTDPNDADSDDDGVPDGLEPNPSDDTDGDGLINALDPDSDNDGLFDGTEMGRDCEGTGTSASAGHCRPDADDGDTTTDPLNPDTDGGGVRDGSEDTNLNGRIDDDELDPNDASDDDDVVDSDGDGLSDGLEDTLGSDPDDADSDDDGLPDGEEPNPSDDTDGDGLINVRDPDSDNDGLFDGTETGRDCSGEGTLANSPTCIPDADDGETTTSPLDPDTDGGGVRDGDEDTNKNGVVDPGETDPNDAADDGPSGVRGATLEGGGCGCRTTGAGAPMQGGLWMALLGFGLFFWRRRNEREKLS